jgi:hypothetical protein
MVVIGKQNNLILVTFVLAKETEDSGNFNFYPNIGISTGARHFRTIVTIKNLGYQFNRLVNFFKLI